MSDQLNVGQVSCFVQRSGKKLGCHHQHDLICGPRPCKAIAGSRRKDIEIPWTMLSASGAAIRRPLEGNLSQSLEIQKMSRMFMFGNRSEEHTSELQSQSNLVCRLLLEKKND